MASNPQLNFKSAGIKLHMLWRCIAFIRSEYQVTDTRRIRTSKIAWCLNWVHTFQCRWIRPSDFLHVATWLASFFCSGFAYYPDGQTTGDCGWTWVIFAFVSCLFPNIVLTHDVNGQSYWTQTCQKLFSQCSQWWQSIHLSFCRLAISIFVMDVNWTGIQQRWWWQPPTLQRICGTAMAIGNFNWHRGHYYH